jgi:hypothetical protein
VVVLNGTSTPGAAGYFTTKLRNAGYSTLTPLDASSSTVTSTLVVVTETGTTAGGEAVAHELGLSSAAVTLTTAQSSDPIPSGALSEANIVVLIGSDISSQAQGGTTTTTAASTSSSSTTAASSTTG